MSDLIDTTEMYLRTVFELQEEGIVPLRARIAERLDQTGPTVSQTVARMERDGLLTVAEDRHIELTPAGQAQAVRVMRKHRLAERLLVEVIGLEWAQVHEEACRWEHVMSDQVERRLTELLDHPTESPFGNPIPGLREIDPAAQDHPPARGTRLGELTDLEQTDVTVLRIAESLQEQGELMLALQAAGVRPGATISVARNEAGGVRAAAADTAVDLSMDQANGITVSR